MVIYFGLPSSLSAARNVVNCVCATNLYLHLTVYVELNHPFVHHILCVDTWIMPNSKGKCINANLFTSLARSDLFYLPVLCCVCRWFSIWVTKGHFIKTTAFFLRISSSDVLCFIACIARYITRWTNLNYFKICGMITTTFYEPFDHFGSVNTVYIICIRSFFRRMVEGYFHLNWITLAGLSWPLSYSDVVKFKQRTQNNEYFHFFRQDTFFLKNQTILRGNHDVHGKS